MESPPSGTEWLPSPLARAAESRPPPFPALQSLSPPLPVYLKLSTGGGKEEEGEGGREVEGGSGGDGGGGEKEGQVRRQQPLPPNLPTPCPSQRELCPGALLQAFRSGWAKGKVSVALSPFWALWTVQRKGDGVGLHSCAPGVAGGTGSVP